MKVLLYPAARGEDDGQGGVRRVLEGMQQHLPAHGVELVDDPGEADLIACHITVPAALSRFPEKAFVAHCHGLYWSPEYQWPHWAHAANDAVLAAVRVADATTAPTEWVANAIRRHTCRPVDVIPHGVDLKEYRPPKDPGDYIWWDKTRIDPVCDPEPIDRLAGLLPGRQFKSTFGVDRPNVEIVGHQAYAAARKLTREAALYLATTRETFGIGTLQAMAAGVPVVGWNWAGQADIVRPEIDGRLVTPGDYAALAEAVEWAFAERARLSAAARERAGEYRWADIAGQYAAVYRRVLEARSKPGPRVSVIVRAYKLDAYLDDALASVAAQHDDDWECVVVDDASPDRCGEIADSWAAKDPRFVAVHNETNQYLAGAMNAGIEAAEGRYLLPLDADDMLTPSAVGALADALDTDRTIDVAYGNIEWIQPSGKRAHSGWPVPFDYARQLGGHNQVPYSAMFRRRAWENTAGYRRRCRTAEDPDFWTRLASYGYTPKMVTQADTLIYRIRSDSISQTHGTRPWADWLGWHADPSRSPAGALRDTSPAVPSLDPPVIAVVIPCGPDHALLVQDAIDSVEAQTFDQWECIVADDTGGRLPPLPAWVKIVPGGGGTAASRNAAIRAASARLILPLDADDYLQPGCLDAMLAVHRQTGDIVYSDFWEDPKVAGVFQVFNVPDYEPSYLAAKLVPTWGVTSLFRREWWETVGGFDETLPAWEDWAFSLSLAAIGICATRISAPLWTYRKHTGVRRLNNMRSFDEGKAALQAKFGRYWKGEDLMACRSCGGRRATVGVVAAASRAPAQFGDDVLIVTYTGPKAGTTLWRGASGTTYRFAAGDGPKYVRRGDAGMFEGRSDFRIEQQVATAVESAAPALVAEGAP